MLIPLGWLTLPLAYLCWIAASFLLYLVTTLRGHWRSRYGVALLVAPTTLLTFISGQNGLLSAALLAGGLQHLRQRPILAGILLGLLSYKPQFVLLLPVILISARSLRAILSGVLTVLAAMAMTSVLLGWSIWPGWIAGFPEYQRLLAANQATLDHLMPTVFAGIHAIGMPFSVAVVIQLAMSLVVAVSCWRAFAHCMSDRAIAMAMIGPLIVSPYVMIYDTPMLASAVAISWRSRLAVGDAIHVREICLVVVTFACILNMLSVSLPLLAPLLMFVLFLVIARSATHAVISVA